MTTVKSFTAPAYPPGSAVIERHPSVSLADERCSHGHRPTGRPFDRPKRPELEIRWAAPQPATKHGSFGHPGGDLKRGPLVSGPATGACVRLAQSPDRPYVSIVIAIRNGAATIQRCIDSVRGQGFDDWELIVIDGLSSDGTQDILRRNQASIRYWISEPDRGIYDAWNKALAKANGEWICFLGSDDRLHDHDVLDKMVGPLREAEGRYRVVYASIDKVAESGQVLLTWGRPWPSVRDEFRKGMAIPHQAIFHHRTLFERHGSFDDRFRISGDYELLLRELIEHDALFVPDLVVVDMGAGGLADLSANRAVMLRESYRARHAHGLTRRSESLGLSLERLRQHSREWLTRHLGSRVANSVARAYRFALRRRGAKD
jgi:hypothetical protein